APVRRISQKGPSAGTPAGRARPQTLPPRLQRIVGRDETVEALCSEVRSWRFISIVGPGGVGKTTVAVAVAHRLATEFIDAICFVDLSTLREATLVVPAVASAVGCLGQTQDSLPRLLAFLADHRL